MPQSVELVLKLCSTVSREKYKKIRKKTLNTFCVPSLSLTKKLFENEENFFTKVRTKKVDRKHRTKRREDDWRKNIQFVFFLIVTLS